MPDFYDNLPPLLNKINQQLAAVPIAECDEAIVDLPGDVFRFDPHPYRMAGAPYSTRSPFSLRQTVVSKILDVNRALRPEGLALKIFDGYRPLAVQSYMVDRTFQQFRSDPQNASLPDEKIWDQVFTLWARPNRDPMQPPPHSTGGAVDLTLVDLDGQPLDMGSEIDETGPVQLPDHFVDRNPAIHSRRARLKTAMSSAGFTPLLHEWWHFSYGDRHWALATRASAAIYGRVD